MSLKVPRNFKTISEDALVDQYAKIRRTYAHQDRYHARRQNDTKNLSFLAKASILGGALLAVAVLHKPVMALFAAYL